MEEIPILSTRERAELLNSLEKAQARVRAGKAVQYDPDTFKKRLIGIYRGDKR
jgi:ribosomal protein L29